MSNAGASVQGDCRCGHPHASHNADGSCAWSWEDSDGFPWACECNEYAPRGSGEPS